MSAYAVENRRKKWYIGEKHIKKKIQVQKEAPCRIEMFCAELFVEDAPDAGIIYGLRYAYTASPSLTGSVGQPWIRGRA